MHRSDVGVRGPPGRACAHSGRWLTREHGDRVREHAREHQRAAANAKGHVRGTHHVESSDAHCDDKQRHASRGSRTEGVGPRGARPMTCPHLR